MASSEADNALFNNAATSDQAHNVNMTALLPPPLGQSPPAITGKRAHSERSVPRSDRILRSGGEPVSATALNDALQHVDVVRPRASTPGITPMRKRQRTRIGIGGSDRFIPNRSGQDLPTSYTLLHDEGSPATPLRNQWNIHSTEVNSQKQDANRTYSNLLRSEMFGTEIPQSIPQSRDGNGSKSRTPPGHGSILAGPHLTPSTPRRNMFSFGPIHTPSLTPRSTSRSERGPNINVRSELYSLSPIKHSSQTMLLSPRKTPRAVSQVPYKVLDAPDLQDDFYLNLVDWGQNDILAVGLADTVYLWNRDDGTVKTLCKLDNDSVTSVSWIQRGAHLAIGTTKGLLHIYDTLADRRLRTMTGHSARISSLAWNAHILSTGSRDRTILHRDVRLPAQYLRRLTGHKQEVCGLKWNPETEQLASGGNDNKIFVWDRMDERWLHRWGEQEGGHKAAVKAIAWSPHQRGLLASGGGTADRCIKFWNTVSTAQTTKRSSILPPNLQPDGEGFGFGFSTGSLSPSADQLASPSQPNPHLLRSHDTGSQVCNLLFSTLTSELVSTHGYSQHAINIWKYPSMQQIASLTGHTYRVLYLSMSPDGAVIVTGAGDETLRFWDVFSRKEKNPRRGIVGEWGIIR